MAYLKAFLQQHQIKVRIVDLNMELYDLATDDARQLWELSNYHYWLHEKLFFKIEHILRPHLDRILQRIMENEPGIIGFSTVFESRLLSLLLAERIKGLSPDIAVVFGGALCAPHALRDEIAASPWVDYVISGEGELPLLALARAIEENAIWQQLPGVTYLDGSNTIISQTALPIPDLDSIPFPDFSDYELDRYSLPNVLPLLMSRGCPAGCAFCPERILWRGYRTRSPQNIVDEMEHRVKQMGISRFVVLDQLMNGSMPVLKATAQVIIERGMEVFWGGNMRLDRDLDASTCRLLRKAGCLAFDFGLESGSKKVLASLRKPQPLKLAPKIFKNAHETGIRVQVNLMIGAPGESWLEFLRTLWLLLKCSRWIDNIGSLNLFYVMPGTDIAQNPEKFGVRSQTLESTGEFWISTDSQNDFETRWLRLKIMHKFLKILGIENPFPLPDEGEAMMRLGLYYFNNQEYGRASSFFRKALEYAPNSQAALRLLEEASGNNLGLRIED